MNYKYYFCSCILLLVAGLAKAQNTDSLTLQQCLDIALRNNLQIKQSGLTAEQDRVYYNQARENLLPSVNGSVVHTVSNGRSLDPTSYSYVNQQITTANYGLNGNLTLFSGLSYVNNIRQTRLAFEAGKMDFQQAKDVVTLNLITAYLQVLSNTDLLAQAKAQVEVSRQNVQRQTILNNAGSIKPSDLYDIQGQLASDQLAVINAQNTLESSRLALLQIMNIPYQENVKIVRIQSPNAFTRFPYTADQVYQEALGGLALVKSAELKRQSAEKGVKVAQGGLFPTLSLSGGISTNYSSLQERQGAVALDSAQVATGSYTRATPNGPVTGQVYYQQKDYAMSKISYGNQFKNNYASGISLNLQLPILNFFQKRNNVTIAKLNLQNAQYIEETTKVQLRQNVEQAYVNMVAAYNSYQVLLDQVKAFQESFRTAQIRFNDGVLNSVDFIVIKNKLDQANTNLIIAKYDYAIRLKILDYYQGKL